MARVETLLISAAPGELRLALLAEGRAVEFRVDRGAAAPGDLLLGRVLSVQRALNAAFVDIGQPLPAFLPQAAGQTEGARLLVQVTAAARGGKGAEVTASPSLQGGLLAYTPSRAGLNLSRRILEETERSRLSSLLKGRLLPGEGVMVRTQAAGASEQTLLDELDRLRGDWLGLEAEAAALQPPARLRAPSPLARLLAEHAGLRRVVTDDAAALAVFKADFPAAELCPPRAGPLFEQFHCADDWDRALAPRLPLPGGGALLFGTAAGITVIDIDSGRSSPAEANLAAVAEIARQLRLRGLSGHVLVDVIPMRERSALARVTEALKQAVSGDPTPTHVVGTTPLGMIELTRERRGPALAEMLLAEAAPQPSADSLALDGLRRLLREAEASPGRRRGLAAPAALLEALRRYPAALAETERRLGHALTLTLDAALGQCEVIEETP